MGDIHDIKQKIVSTNSVIEIIEQQGGVQLLPPAVEQWLSANHSIRNAIVWETSSGPEVYKDWPQSRKDDLQAAFTKAWNFDSVALTDPPANILQHPDADAPTTALSQHDARWLYLASVGQSLAVEIGSRVPWSCSNYSSSNLAVLFDSRQFYSWSASANGYQIEDMQGGYVVPSTPRTMYSVPPRQRSRRRSPQGHDRAHASVVSRQHEPQRGRSYHGSVRRGLALPGRGSCRPHD